MHAPTILRISAAALLTVALVSPGLAAQAAPERVAATSTSSGTATTTSDAGRLMLLLDASGSMADSISGGSTKILAARKALHTVVSDLPDAQQVGLRVFGARMSKSSGTACTDSQRLVALGTGNRAALDQAIDRVTPFGETPIGYALQQAGKDLGTSGKRTIVLVSDGEATCAPDPCTGAKQLADNGVTTRIDVVGLAVTGAARAKLRCIASGGDGTYYAADSADDLAQALDQVATRSAQPLVATGTKVTGTNTRVDAPLVGNGEWIDTLGGVGTDRQTLYYLVHRSQAESTLHVSVDTPLGTESDLIGLTLIDSEGHTCGYQHDNDSPLFEQRSMLETSVSIPESRDASDIPCAAAGDFVVQVDHGYHNLTGVGSRDDIPIELRVQEEPAVESVESLPATAETPQWSDPVLTGAKTATVGGGSLNAPTVLTTGAYTGSIATGDTQVFGVDLAYGQSLAAAVRVSVTPLLAEQLRTSAGWPDLSVHVLSPSRADAAGNYFRGSSAVREQRRSNAINESSDGIIVYNFTDTVNYRNRFATSDELRGASEAGRYLVVVSLLNSDANARRNVVPFVLGIDVRGTPSGAPVYLAAADAPTATSAASSMPASSSPGVVRASPVTLVSMVTSAALIAVIAVVVIAAVAVTAVLLIRRRRRRG